MFLLAGYETTANALSFTIYLLSCHPEAESRVLKEVDSFSREKQPQRADLEAFPYLAAAVNEAMRLFPPGEKGVNDVLLWEWAQPA